MKNAILSLLFTLSGGGLGAVYYHLFGCTNGCPITSDPWRTILYFAVVGLILSFAFHRPAKKNNREEP